MVPQLLRPFLLVCLFHFGAAQAEVTPLSPTTEQALARCRVLNHECGTYGGYMAQSLVLCSEFQDLWLAYLHNTESQEEYEQGMQLMHDASRSFRTTCNYSTEVVNFHNPGGERFLTTQAVKIGESDGLVMYGFLNTFKTGRYLLPEERHQLFVEEMERYRQDAEEFAFDLNEQTLSTLKPETVYNFALLGNGTIRAAVEVPGRRSYYAEPEPGVQYAFTHPNHTVLAGSAHQVLLTGGSFIFYECEGRRLYFIANKSGHFVPYFYTLEFMSRALERMGVNPYTVIQVPDMDIAATAVRAYRRIQVPLVIEEDELPELFACAIKLFEDARDQIEISRLERWADGDFSELKAAHLRDLKEWCGSYLNLNCAYKLCVNPLQRNSRPAEIAMGFRQLRAHLEQQQWEEAEWLSRTLLNLLNAPEENSMDAINSYRSSVDVLEFIRSSMDLASDLVAQEAVSADEFQRLKGMTRQLAVLFRLKAEQVLLRGQGYFLNRAASNRLLRINEAMSLLRDHSDSQETYQLSSSIVQDYKRMLDVIRIPPARFELNIPEDNAFWLINCAKDWYYWHYSISEYPGHVDEHMYDGRLKALLIAVLEGRDSSMADDEVRAGTALLKRVLWAAEYARSALMFLDASHQTDPVISEYIADFRAVLRWLEHKTDDDITPRVAAMLKFMESRGCPTDQLQEYVCTDQQGLNAVLKGRLDSIDRVRSHRPLSQYEAEEVIEDARHMANILELYREAGIDHQSYPSVCYDRARDAAQGVVDGLERAMKDGMQAVEVDAHTRRHAVFLVAQLYPASLTALDSNQS